MSPPRLHAPAESGFSLLEALIALVIIMIGLLGIAGMQALGVRETQQAQLRSLAAMDARSMSAMMQSNHAFWSSATAPASISASSATATNCATAACTPAQVAQSNLSYWNQALANLPNGTGSVLRIASDLSTMSPYTYLVTVHWNERQMGGNGSQLSGSSSTQSTSVVVRP